MATFRTFAFHCLATVAAWSATARAEVPAQPPVRPLFALAYWEAMPGPMPLPVFDAMAIEFRGSLIVAGGFTKSLEATKAIQIRHPLHGWLPVGSTLDEPRARGTLTPLGGSRALVLGGFSGTWGHDAQPLSSGETIDLMVAGSSRPIEAWPGSLDGHSATPLPDGRVAVVCECALRVFDPATSSWSDPLELVSERRRHAAVLVGMTLVLIGGDQAGTIESIDLRAASPASELWNSPRLPALDAVAAIALGGHTAFAVGGIDRERAATVNSTWIIDVQKRSASPGPSLGLQHGAHEVTLALHARGVLVLDGEWRADGTRGNANAALLIDPRRTGKVWTLPSLHGPLNLSRRVLVSKLDGSMEAIGGYRYRSPIDAPPDETVGVIVDGSGQRLVVDAAGTAD